MREFLRPDWPGVDWIERALAKFQKFFNSNIASCISVHSIRYSAAPIEGFWNLRIERVKE